MPTHWRNVHPMSGLHANRDSERYVDRDADPCSHELDTGIPDNSDTSRFAIIVYIWLALMIASALIGHSLFLLPTDSSKGNPDEKPKIRQAPI
jgi:hypothetical protein